MMQKGCGMLRRLDLFQSLTLQLMEVCDNGIQAVLKTVVEKSIVGSSPSASAKN